MPSKTQAIILSDHHLFVDLITPVLSKERINVIRQFDFVRPGLAFLEKHSVGLVMLDQVMPAPNAPNEDTLYDRTGIATDYEISLQAIGYIRQSFAHIKIVAVAEDHDPFRCARLIRAGAHGLACKCYGLMDFRRILRRIMSGETLVMPDPLSAPLLRQLSHPVPVLKAKDLHILQLVQKGHSNKEIAQWMGLSPYTVRNRFAGICRSLGVNTRTEAVSKAFEYGLLNY